MTVPLAAVVFYCTWIGGLALLVVLRFILPVGLPLRLRLLLGTGFALAATASLYVPWFTGGDVFNTRLPRLSQQLVSAAYFAALFIAAFLLLRFLVNLIWKILRRSRRAVLISPASRAVFVVVFCAAAGLGTLGVRQGFAPPETVNMDFTLPQLPPEAESFKIVVLADLHICQSATVEELQEIVAKANALRPDLMVIAGDFVDDSIAELDPLTSILAGLEAPLGVWAVSGNHEFYAGYEPWLEYLQNLNIRFLENRSVVVKSPEGIPLFNLAGVMDTDGAHFGLAGAQPQLALKDTDPALPVILLTHRPGVALDAGSRAALVFAGHTHGGCAPLLRQIVALANRGMVSGLYEHEGSSIVVTNGTRLWAGFCLRLNTPPQLIVATLHSPQSAAAGQDSATQPAG